MKKIIALVLALLMALSVPSFAMAADTKAVTTPVKTEKSVSADEFVKMTDAQKAEYLEKADTSKTGFAFTVCVYLFKAVKTVESLTKKELTPLRHFVFSLVEMILKSQVTAMTKEDIVDVYTKVYNTTKSSGRFTGNSVFSCENFDIGGSVAIGFTSESFKSKATGVQLPPYSAKNPSRTCLIKATDIAKAEYTDNGDGTATIVLVPNECANSKPFADSQSKMFNVPDNAEALFKLNPQISWSEGDANKNVSFVNKDGYARVTFNKTTNMMVSAEYVFVSYATMKHTNILLIKDKDCSAKFVTTWTYPGA